MERPLIFVTNDDGYQAKGIEKITEIAGNYGDVVVVAPDRGYSGYSHAITMRTPIFLTPVEQRKGLTRYYCEGTPVDCVKMGLDELMVDRLPDLIISGINHGSNSNTSVLYSGTMGAAIEGLMYKIPSIGFSLTDHDLDADFTAFDRWAPKIIDMVMKQPEEARREICLNVNVPNIPHAEIKGIKLCRQTRGNWRERFQHSVDPNGRDYYWMQGIFYNDEPEAVDSDEWALKNGYISVVPVRVDLTDYQILERLKEARI